MGWLIDQVLLYQAASCLLSDEGLLLGTAGIFAMYLAAIVHDYGHKGELMHLRLM
jgi:hypothetical protein